MLGGSVQHVLRNDRIQIGVESGFTFGWDSDKTVIAVGGGSQAVGAIVAAEAMSPTTQVYGVQAAGAPAIRSPSAR